MSDKVQSLMKDTVDKIKATLDVDTAMGTPINLQDGTTIIPINKVNFGFAAGGSDIPSKNQTGLFAGGAGAAVTVTPMAFIVAKDGHARVMQIEPFTSSVDRLIQQAPEFVDKITSLIPKKKPKEEEVEAEGVDTIDMN